MPHLFRETEAVRALKASIGSLAEQDPDLLADMIEGETGLFECFDAMLAANAQDAAFAEACSRAADDMKARAARFEARIGARRALIEQAMMVAEVTKVERPLATLSLATRAPAVLITEEPEIPARFWKAGKPTLDRKAIGDALKAGEPVPGACLTNQAPSLTIRSK